MIASEPEALEALLPQEGVVTIAGAEQFHELALTCHSVRETYPVPVLCFDAGLRPEQIDWLRNSVPACSVTRLPPGAREAVGTEDLGAGALLSATRTFLLQQSPFRRTVWLDPGLVILRGLAELFTELDRGPVPGPTTQCFSAWDLERDAEQLATHADTQAKSPNAALDAYPWRVETVAASASATPPTDGNLLLDRLRYRYPDARIVQLDLPADGPAMLRSLAASTPGPLHERQRAPARPVMKLVCMMGVKSSPHLVEAFLDHYYRLGIDEFRIILHSEPGDPRAGVVLESLKRYHIAPVIHASEFSALVKRRYFLDVIARHCAGEDWVVYADIDELQVYPSPLEEVLGQCDEHGYVFVAGRFVDRLAAGGQLSEIHPGVPIWEQFPFTAPLTERIARGWTGKVCAAKARIALGEGAHAIFYGPDPVRNYVRTRRDPRGHPTVIDVHHFKWDETLIRRAEEKVDAEGGDRDVIDGESFMHEYRSVLEHVRHGRLVTDDVTLAGTPPLHYVRPPRQGKQPARPSALEGVARYMAEGPENGWDAPSRFGAPGRLYRRILLRAVRPYAVRRAEFNAAIFEALSDLSYRQAASRARIEEISRRRDGR